MAIYAFLNEANRAVNFVASDTFPEVIPNGVMAVELNQTSYGYGWLWDGQVLIDDAPPAPPVIPQSVTPTQVRLLLLAQGLLDDVEQIIAQSDRATQITWQYASKFQRNDPLLIQLATNLNLTPEQVDQFFISAASL